ncbi:MAG: hypothetical protein QF632_03245 [Candidatus Woesearchaeota archaeon]|jgi:hypothetical protein|nr:hypothetical protein [Candidatus Woesearchaeota archaeon]MDP7323751.1 hypothetical protein [Candidatus Woesearchaeota archaeon]MDP7457489.1 hypothetical protein [Candidatus Woesearchaeota archaeon]
MFEYQLFVEEFEFLETGDFFLGGYFSRRIKKTIVISNLDRRIFKKQWKKMGFKISHLKKFLKEFKKEEYPEIWQGSVPPFEKKEVDLSRRNFCKAALAAGILLQGAQIFNIADQFSIFAGEIEEEKKKPEDPLASKVQIKSMEDTYKIKLKGAFTIGEIGMISRALKIIIRGCGDFRKKDFIKLTIEKYDLDTPPNEQMKKVKELKDHIDEMRKNFGKLYAFDQNLKKFYTELYNKAPNKKALGFTLYEISTDDFKEFLNHRKRFDLREINLVLLGTSQSSAKGSDVVQIDSLEDLEEDYLPTFLHEVAGHALVLDPSTKGHDELSSIFTLYRRSFVSDYANLEAFMKKLSAKVQAYFDSSMKVSKGLLELSLRVVRICEYFLKYSKFENAQVKKEYQDMEKFAREMYGLGMTILNGSPELLNIIAGHSEEIMEEIEFPAEDVAEIASYMLRGKLPDNRGIQMKAKALKKFYEVNYSDKEIEVQEIMNVRLAA